MELQNQEVYTNFIFQRLPESIKIEMPKVSGDKRVYVQFSSMPRYKLNIAIYKADVYSRSILIEGEWDKSGEVGKVSFILYCPVNKSPKEILENLEYKCIKEVAKCYTNEELEVSENVQKEKIAKILGKVDFQSIFDSAKRNKL